MVRSWRSLKFFTIGALALGMMSCTEAPTEADDGGPEPGIPSTYQQFDYEFRITDEDGHPIPGAAARAIHTATGDTTTVVANGDGWAAFDGDDQLYEGHNSLMIMPPKSNSSSDEGFSHVRAHYTSRNQLVAEDYRTVTGEERLHNFNVVGWYQSMDGHASHSAVDVDDNRRSTRIDGTSVNIFVSDDYSASKPSLIIRAGPRFEAMKQIMGKADDFGGVLGPNSLFATEQIYIQTMVPQDYDQASKFDRDSWEEHFKELNENLSHYNGSSAFLYDGHYMDESDVDGYRNQSNVLIVDFVPNGDPNFERPVIKRFNNLTGTPKYIESGAVVISETVSAFNKENFYWGTIDELPYAYRPPGDCTAHWYTDQGPPPSDCPWRTEEITAFDRYMQEFAGLFSYDRLRSGGYNVRLDAPYNWNNTVNSFWNSVENN